jgi:hypothetical protein
MNISSAHFRIVVLLAGCLSVAIGCGKADPRGAVSGEVIYNGNPVETGMVSFEPTEAVITPRTVVIEKGKYRLDEAGGLKPGAYCVRITAADASKASQTASKNILGLVDFVPLLPPTWNAQSKLSVDVKPGRNVFHFRGKKSELPSVEVVPQ